MTDKVNHQEKRRIGGLGWAGILLLAIVLTGCLPEPSPAPEIQLEQIQLPAGYSITVFADSIENARSMALSPSGVLLSERDGPEKCMPSLMRMGMDALTCTT